MTIRMARVGRVLVAGAAALALVLTLLPARAATGGYGMDRPFNVATNAYTFGQAPAFAPDGRVVFHQDFGGGEQIYLANLDGSGRSCVTGGPPAPDLVPQMR